MRPLKNMKAVAEIAGVSPATVSRVINSPQIVKETTKKSVLDAMKKCGYVYNSVAADFTRQKNSMIGLIIFTVRSSIHADLIEGIQDELSGTKFSLIIANSKYEAETEAALINLFRERKLSGIIVAGTTDENKKLLKQLNQNGVPVVITWEIPSDEIFSCVGFDNYAAASMITNYLLEKGRRRIGLIIGDYTRIERVRQRYYGFIDTLKKHEIQTNDSLVISRTPSPSNGAEAMNMLLDRHQELDGVFAASDAFALGAISVVKKRGLKIPEDISICGFDNDDFACYCDPSLTTIDVPGYEMGRYAARVIIDQQNKKTMTKVRHCLPTKLIIRSSV